MSEEKKDLKPEEKTPEGGSLPENKPAEGGEKPEGEKPNEAEELKKELEAEKALREKAESDRDNYREGMFSAKAGKDSLFEEKTEETPATTKQPVKDPLEADEDGWKEVDRRAQDVAQKTFSGEQRKQVILNEKVAKKKWLVEHPELLNDGLRIAVLDEFTSKHGTSVEGIQMDLERAYKFYKVENDIEVKPDTKTDEARKAEEALSSTPTGGGAERGGGFSDDEVGIMKDFDIKPELFEQFRQKVLSGEFEVPQEVINLLKR